MHEASIAQALLETALSAVREASAPSRPQRITHVVVLAGVLSGVDGECLDLYFQQLIPGTPAEGATLEVVTRPARLVCRACGEAVEYDGQRPVALQCAKCGGNNALQGGYELSIERIETEEMEP